jgi:hypothetical protein
MKTKETGIKRIREFIEKQRQIGERQFGDKMVKRYNKTANEFYSQFANTIYYQDKNGQETHLDIQTLWYFRTNEMLNAQKHLIPTEDTFLEKIGNMYVIHWKELNSTQKKEFKNEVLWWIELINKNLIR